MLFIKSVIECLLFMLICYQTFISLTIYYFLFKPNWHDKSINLFLKMQQIRYFVMTIMTWEIFFFFFCIFLFPTKIISNWLTTKQLDVRQKLTDVKCIDENLPTKNVWTKTYRLKMYRQKLTDLKCIDKKLTVLKLTDYKCIDKN